MSVSREGFVGYTVTLKTNLSSDDFEFFNDFEEAHKEYNKYTSNGKVLLVVDGVNNPAQMLRHLDGACRNEDFGKPD